MTRKNTIDYNKCTDGTRIYKATYKFKNIFGDVREYDIRYIIHKDGSPYFCMKDIGRAMGLSHFSNAVRNVDPAHKVKKKMYSETITQFDGKVVKQAFIYNFLSDMGTRQAIGKSRKNGAEEFKQWLFGTIVPLINEGEIKNVEWMDKTDDEKLNIHGANEYGTRFFNGQYMTITEFMVSHCLKPIYYDKTVLEKKVIKYCCERNIIIESVKIGKSKYNTYPYIALAEVFLSHANDIIKNRNIGG